MNIRDVVHDVKAGEGRVGDAIKKAVKDGRKTFKDGESELETWVFKKVDGFLGDVFGESEEGEPSDDEDGEKKYDSIIDEVRDKVVRR